MDANQDFAGESIDMQLYRLAIRVSRRLFVFWRAIGTSTYFIHRNNYSQLFAHFIMIGWTKDSDNPDPFSAVDPDLCLQLCNFLKLQRNAGQRCH